MIAEILNPFLYVKKLVKRSDGRWVEETVQPKEELKMYEFHATDYTSGDTFDVFDVKDKRVIIDQIVVAHTGAYLNVRAIPTELTGLDGHSADIFSMLTISRSSGNPIRHMSTHNLSVIQKSDVFEHITEPTSDLEGRALALKRPITLPQGGAVYLEASSNNSSGETGRGSVKIIWREIEI